MNYRNCSNPARPSTSSKSNQNPERTHPIRVQAQVHPDLRLTAALACMTFAHSLQLGCSASPGRLGAGGAGLPLPTGPVQRTGPSLQKPIRQVRGPGDPPGGDLRVILSNGYADHGPGRPGWHLQQEGGSVRGEPRWKARANGGGLRDRADGRARSPADVRATCCSAPFPPC